MELQEMLHSHNMKLSWFSDEEKADTEGLIRLMGSANVDGLEEDMGLKIPFRAVRVDQGQAFNVRRVNGLLGKQVSEQQPDMHTNIFTFTILSNTNENQQSQLAKSRKTFSTLKGTYLLGSIPTMDNRLPPLIVKPIPPFRPLDINVQHGIKVAF
jgi:hypothetical protein